MGEQEYPFAEVLTLRRKVERLEGKYDEVAKLADERRQTLRQKQDEIYRLTNKVERLEAITDATFDAGVRKGIGKVAGIVEHLRNTYAMHSPERRVLTLAFNTIHAAAKQQTGEVSSREPITEEHREHARRQLQPVIDAIDSAGKEVAGEAGSKEARTQTGPASPVSEMVRSLYDLAYHASRNAHQAWEHETPFEVCTTEVCINARETLDVFIDLTHCDEDGKEKCVMGDDGICSCGYDAKAHQGMYP